MPPQALCPCFPWRTKTGASLCASQFHQEMQHSERKVMTQIIQSDVREGVIMKIVTPFPGDGRFEKRILDADFCKTCSFAFFQTPCRDSWYSWANTLRATRNRLRSLTEVCSCRYALPWKPTHPISGFVMLSHTHIF